MSDAIDRQVAIDAFGGSLCAYETESGREYGISFSGVERILKSLPSAQPERKSVIYSGDGYADGHMVYDLAECPECGYEYEESDRSWGEPYCPHCGQLLNWDAEGEEDE